MAQAEIVTVSTAVIQLDQLIKWMGLSETGGQARFMIDAGKVKVNGTIAKERRKKIHPGDRIEIEGQEYIIQQETESQDAD